MTLTVGTASGNKEVTAFHIGASSGTKTVIEGWVGAASGNKQFYSATPTPTPLSVLASPGDLGWEVSGPYFQTLPTTASASGGTPPYSYAWEIDSVSASADSPTSATSSFSSTDEEPATATCTVTDSLGNTGLSNGVSIT